MRVLVLAVLALVAVSSIASAGDVTAVAKGGKLVVKGSDDGDVLAIDLDVSLLRVTPAAGTTVNGLATPASFTVTGTITVDLGAGDDMLTFEDVAVPADLKVKLGDGFDTFRLVDAAVVGATTIDLGAGAGSVAFCSADAGKGVTVKGGAAGIGAAAASCQGVDNADVEAKDGVAIAFGNFDVAGDLAVKLKTGPATVILANSGAAGKGTFAFGDGSTHLGLCDAGIGGNLGVTMKGGTTTSSISCTVAGNTTSSSGSHGVIVVGAQVGGSLIVKGGKENDAVLMTDSGINQKMKLALSDGLNTFLATAGLVGTSLAVTGGKGNDVVSATTLTVGDDAKFAVGDGVNVVTLGTAVIGENLTIKTGKDNDVITTDQTTVGGKKTIKPGGGNDTVQ